MTIEELQEMLDGLSVPDRLEITILREVRQYRNPAPHHAEVLFSLPVASWPDDHPTTERAVASQVEIPLDDVDVARETATLTVRSVADRAEEEDKRGLLP